MESLHVRLMDGWMINLMDLNITTKKRMFLPGDQFSVFQSRLVTVFREKGMKKHLTLTL